VQAQRRIKQITCGSGGVIHDYVPFYFGPLSVMLLNLKTGRVSGYDEGQEPLIYLVTTAQIVQDAGCRFVFSDGHGVAAMTQWFEDLAMLDQVDWGVVRDRYWMDTSTDNDRKRRKQAEFLVRESLDWSLIKQIGVQNIAAKKRVEAVLSLYNYRFQPNVSVRPEWYYY